MRPKYLCLLLMLISAALVLTGCKGKTAPGTPSAGPEKTVLTVDVYNTNEAYLPFFAYVKSQVPDLEFEFNAFRGANGSQYSTNELEQGNQADIYLTSRSECKDEASEKNLIDLSAYPFLENISTGVLDSVSVNGAVYLLPIRTMVLGIAYNKTLLEEWGMGLPQNYQDLAALKEKCDENGMLLCKQLGKYPGGGFQVVMSLAAMGFLNTPEGAQWQKDFLAGEDTDFSIWDSTLSYMQKLLDLGFFEVEDEKYPYSPEDPTGLMHRGTLFAITQNAFNPNSGAEVTTDEFGLMPFISEDGSRNIYTYTPNSYIGLSNKLLEPGNEQKLERALKVMELYAGAPGQQALHYDKDNFSILKDVPMDENSFLYDAYLAGLEGRMLMTIYNTWNQYDLIIEPGNTFLNWCKGEGEVTDITDAMKRRREEAKATGGAPVYCECAEDLSMEQSAEIVAAVYGKLADADAGLMSIGKTYPGELREYTLNGETYTINGLESNQKGVNGRLYKGHVTQENSWVILPGTYGNTKSIALLHLTGAEIKDLVSGGFDMLGNGHIYPYVLTVRGGQELEDGRTYTVATVPDNYSETAAEAGKVEFIDIPDFLNVYSDTLGSFGTLSGEMSFNW